MANLLTAALTIEGTRPLLFHAFTPDAIPLSGKRERSGVAGNDPSEWRRTVLADDGRLFLEPTYLFGCLRDGARFTPRKRGTLQPYLTATLLVLDDRVWFNRSLPAELPTDPDQPVYLDVRSVRNPATKARNVRYRVGLSRGWRATFHIRWDKTVVSRGELEAVAIDAGRLVGVGSGRAIGFGRSELRAFTIADEPA
jgi:hypothetical protein